MTKRQRDAMVRRLQGIKEKLTEEQDKAWNQSRTDYDVGAHIQKPLSRAIESIYDAIEELIAG